MKHKSLICLLAAGLLGSSFQAGAQTTFTMQVVADNDFAIFAGTTNGVTELLYQNNSSWQSQVADLSTLNFTLLPGETTLYLLGMGGGNEENISGIINGVDITSIPVRVSSDIGPLLSGYETQNSFGTVSDGSFSANLGDVQTAFPSLTWASATNLINTADIVIQQSLNHVGYDFSSETAHLFQIRANDVGVSGTPGYPLISYPVDQGSGYDIYSSIYGTTTPGTVVTNVYYSLNHGPLKSASTTNNWVNWFTQDYLTPGLNTLSVYAANASGVVTGPNTIQFTTATNAVLPTADLALKVTVAPATVAAGNSFVYTLTVTNRGPAAADGIVVSNRIPASLQFVSASGGSSPVNGVLLASLGSLSAGATASIQVILQSVAAGKVTNVFQVFASQPDPVLTNNIAKVISTATSVPEKLVNVVASITATPNPAIVGSPLTYLVTVTNRSSNPATGVIVNDTLPANVTFVSAVSSQGSVSTKPNLVTGFFGTLSGGQAATLTIVVVPKAAGVLADKITLATTQPNLNRVGAVNATTVLPAASTNLTLTLLSPITLNLQTGLYEQRVQVLNNGPTVPAWVRVFVAGLPVNGRLWNANGTFYTVPFVQSNARLAVGSNVVMLLKYYVRERAPQGLVLTPQGGPAVATPIVLSKSLTANSGPATEGKSEE